MMLFSNNLLLTDVIFLYETGPVHYNKYLVSTVDTGGMVL